MLGPHLTNENLAEVLARAKHRTKKEIGRLVRVLDPMPDVPSRIDPLGPEPAQLVSSAPTWSQFVGSMNPTRELAPGNRPLDWTENTAEQPTGDRCQARAELALANGSALERGELALADGAALERGELVLADGSALERGELVLADGSALERGELALADGAALERGELVLADGAALERGELALADGAAPVRLTPLRYKVQFAASEEYVKLVEQAKALLSHSAPRAGLAEVHLRAMRALVAELERKKYAVTARPQQRARDTSTPAVPTPEAHQVRERVGEGRSKAEPASKAELKAESKAEFKAEPASKSMSARADEPEPAHHAEPGGLRWRGRYVSPAVRRAVFARDQARCAFTSGSGQRCREKNGLELHHSRAFARGGEHTEENLALRCRAHNDLAAEKDFGRSYIELARDSTEHEPWAAHEATRGDARAGLR